MMLKKYLLKSIFISTTTMVIIPMGLVYTPQSNCAQTMGATEFINTNMKNVHDSVDVAIGWFTRFVRGKDRKGFTDYVMELESEIKGIEKNVIAQFKQHANGAKKSSSNEYHVVIDHMEKILNDVYAMLVDLHKTLHPHRNANFMQVKSAFQSVSNKNTKRVLEIQKRLLKLQPDLQKISPSAATEIDAILKKCKRLTNSFSQTEIFGAICKRCRK